MAKGLPSSVVDVFLSVQNQVPGKHSGSSGRLTKLIDCQVKKYVGPGQADERVVVEAREGFQGLSSTVRNVATGTSTSVDWSAPQVLSSLGDQLVSISQEVPRVYADSTSTWSAYPTARILPDKLSQEIYHTSNHTIQVPDGAQLGDSTGLVWTETGYTQLGKPIGSTWFGIKSNLGTWVTTPRQLYAPATDSIRTMAKILSDGSRFWVFWNDEAAGFGINVACYNEQGQLLGSTRLTQNWHNTPGYWDVTFQASTVLVAQPGGYDPPNDVGVQFTKLVFSSGTITPTNHTDLTVPCNGGLSWVTNDADGNRAYLASLGPGSGPGFYHLRGAAVNPSTLTSTHLYDTGLNLPSQPDGIVGWTVPNSGNFDLNLCYSMLTWQARVHGPVYDPALRNINTYLVTFGGSSSLVRVTQSVLLVSRAFQRNGEYFAYTYYQSGSGLVLTSTPISVTITLGDYMIGNGSQSITVLSGDYTTGGPLPGSTHNFIVVTNGQTPVSITGSDTVAMYTVTAGDSLNLGVGAIPVGTVLLVWTFANLPSSDNFYGMSMLKVTDSSISGANGSFFIIPSNNTTPGLVYTQLTSTANTTPALGTFTATGTVEVDPNAIYPISSLPAQIGQDTAFMYIGGNLTISGASGTGNNATFVCSRVMLSSTVDPNSPVWCNPRVGPCLVAQRTTQTTSPGVGFGYVVSPLSPFTWSFVNTKADASYVGTTLSVTGAGTTDDGGFLVTGVTGGAFITAGTDAAATTAQVFSDPFPVVSVDIPLSQTPYTFSFAGLTTDYSFIGATLQLTGARHAANDGTYTISWLDPSSTHVFVALPTNGKTNQVNETFNDDAPPSVVIVKPGGSQAEYQPVWFITPLTGSQPQVGCFERGLAYADWRFEGETTYPGPNTYPLGLSSPFLAENVHSVILPYRAKSFTAGQTVTTPQGTSTSIVTDTLESTVGLKRFQLDASPGLATEAFNELILPGPLGGSFTSSGFHEQGVNLGPEAPFLVAQEHDTTAFGANQGQIQVRVTYEWMDENGERGYSNPSPALIFNLQAPNNTYTCGGRLPLPLSGTGGPVANTYGITNRTIVAICLYRTAIVNGVPTTQLYKATNDLNTNGLYDESGTAGSGFAFPDTYTWYYRDQSLDSAIVDQEALYTSRGLLPRFPVPPLSQGCAWENRTWVVGYDDAVWCSGDKQEGDSNWFFPGFRLPLSGDEAVTVTPMEQYLIIGGKSRMWYLPAQSFPNNTGVGSFPTPAPLPFPNGSTGYAVTTNAGVVYGSTAGGVWLVTRDLKNHWLSEAVKDDLTGSITGLAVDQNQRVAVSNGTATLFVFDPVPGCWYQWAMPSQVIRLCTWQGQFAYQDTAGVLRQVPGLYRDVTVGGTNHPISPDLTLAGIGFAQSRAVKQAWEMQLIGEYKGPHKLNAVMTYPDDFNESPTNFGPYSPDPAKPYLIAINPAIEEAGQYGLRVFASFEGVSVPGNSFSLELISCEVGVDRKQGLFKLPDGQRVSSG